MKKRVRRALNFFAFNLLFFALYLNFIQKDKTPAPELAPTQSSSVYNEAVSVNEGVKYQDRKAENGNTVAEQQTARVKSEIRPAQN